jgi:hypothetical protein
MKKKLIFQLSFFGLFMAIARIFWFPWNIELLFWLLIFILCAIVIAKKCSGKFFYHGFLISLLISIWLTIGQLVFYNKYISGHQQELDLISKLPDTYSPRIAMIIVGPFFGVMIGIVLGVFCVVAAKMIKHRID